MPASLEGLSDLSRLLTEETPKAAKRYLSRVAEPAAQVVIDAAKATVPVDQGVLEEALAWQKKWGSDGDQTTMEISIGPLRPYWYGSLQEFGTATQPAQHWLGEAWESCKDEVLNVFVTEATGLILDLENKK